MTIVKWWSEVLLLLGESVQRSSFLLTILFGLLVVTSKSPISAVVNLVGTFISSALIFYQLEIELLALVYIMVYVGAIAILFIFVIMMMDVRRTSSTDMKKNTYEGRMSPWVILGSSVAAIGMVVMMVIAANMLLSVQRTGPSDPMDIDFQEVLQIAQRSHVWESIVSSFTQDGLIHSLGYILYTDLLSLLLIVGLVLLAVMIGVITIIQ